MGKSIQATKKPIQIEGASELVVTVPNKAGENVPLAVLAVTEPPAVVNDLLQEQQKRSVRFQDDDHLCLVHEPTSILKTQTPWVFWYSRTELKKLGMQTQRDSAIHRRKIDDCLIGDEDTDDFSVRGLEAFFGTNAASVQRFRREHIRNVLTMAKRSSSGSATMLAQFARQSSGKSGSTRAAHLRAIHDEQEAYKIHQASALSTLQETNDSVVKPSLEDDATCSVTSSESSI